jgi:5-methylcytosine-specific restriction endonuclease McrA
MARLQHKRGRKSNYLKSLNNEYQRTARERCLIRDKFQCRECGSRIRLEWHHITYYVNGESILGKEQDSPEWQVILCETCHQNVHDNPGHIWNPKNKYKQQA